MSASTAPDVALPARHSGDVRLHRGVAVAKAYNNLGSIALGRGETETAITWFEKAVKASPDHFESRYNLAMRYLEKDRVPEAIKLLEQASALSPNHELVHERLGMAYLASGRGEDAYRSFLLVRRLYPKNWEAPLGLAVLQVSANHPDQARRELEDALRLGGEFYLDITSININICPGARSA